MVLQHRAGPCCRELWGCTKFPCTPHPLAWQPSWKVWGVASRCGLERTQMTCRLIILGSGDWIPFWGLEWPTWKPTIQNGSMITHSLARAHPEVVGPLVCQKELMRDSNKWWASPPLQVCGFVRLLAQVHRTQFKLAWGNKGIECLMSLERSRLVLIRAYRNSNGIVSTLLDSSSISWLFLSGHWLRSPFDDKFLPS